MRSTHVTLVLAWATAMAAAAQPIEEVTSPRAAQPAPATPLAHVEVHGTGPLALVLVPGLACDWTVFRSFMKRNETAYTMYAVTLPGMGGGKAPSVPDGYKPSQGLWLANAENAVWQLIDDRKLDKPVVIGHSLGGHLAIRLALRNGERLGGCISIDGAPSLPLGDPSQVLTPTARAAVIDDVAWQQYSALSEQQWGELVRQMATAGTRDQVKAKELGDLMAGTPALTAARYMTEYMAADLVPKLGDLRCRVLMIAAIPDQEFAGIPVQNLRQHFSDAFSLSPSGSLVLFESTLHFVTEDAPAELDRAIAAFVANQPVPGKPVSASPQADSQVVGPPSPGGAP